MRWEENSAALSFSTGQWCIGKPFRWFFPRNDFQHTSEFECQITVGWRDTLPRWDMLCSVQLHDFSACSLSGERKGLCLYKSSCKSCNLDTLRASVMKGCLDTLLPVITQIVNLSLTKGAMRECWLNCFPRWRSLMLTSRILRVFTRYPTCRWSQKLRKAAADQFTRHVLIYPGEPLQSAYKAFHSTETVLVKVQNDIMCAIDSRQSSQK